MVPGDYAERDSKRPRNVGVGDESRPLLREVPYRFERGSPMLAACQLEDMKRYVKGPRAEYSAIDQV